MSYHLLGILLGPLSLSEYPEALVKLDFRTQQHFPGRFRPCQGCFVLSQGVVDIGVPRGSLILG